MKTTKSGQQIKDKKIGLMIENSKKIIENFKITISEKDKQLSNLNIF